MKKLLLSILFLLFTSQVFAQTCSVTTNTQSCSVSLNWLATTVDATHDAATSYKVQRNGIVVGSPTSLTYTDTFTDSGSVGYSYQVIGVNSSGDGLPSSAVLITSPVIPGAPPPTNAVFAITTIGIVADTVGPTTPTPDGMKDVRVSMTGLKSIPVEITVSPSQGGFYKFPFNGSSWVPFLLNFNAGSADLFYTYPYNIPGLKNHIIIKYSDGTTTQADG